MYLMKKVTLLLLMIQKKIYSKELFYYDLIRMDGQHIYVEIDQRLIPVRVRYENNLLWFVSPMGSVTSYDDIEKAGGKFFKKFSKTS